jgi:hypothetical protein
MEGAFLNQGTTVDKVSRMMLKFMFSEESFAITVLLVLQNTTRTNVFHKNVSFQFYIANWYTHSHTHTIR